MKIILKLLLVGLMATTICIFPKTEAYASNSEPYQLVPSDPGSGAYSTGTLRSGYDNVFVTIEKTKLSATSQKDYKLMAYMSNLTLTDYLVDCHVQRTKEAIQGLLDSYVSSIVVRAIAGTVGGAALDAALTLNELGSYSMDYDFYTDARDLYYADKKAIVTISSNIKTIEQWSSTTYKYLNTTSSFYKYESEVEMFKDRK